MYFLKIKSSKEDFICEGDLECWAYKDLRFPNKRIFNFISKYSPKKDEFSEYLLKTNSQTIMAALSGLIDSEGSINWYGLKRIIRVRMRNKNYLKNWATLLNNMGIGCKFRKNNELEYEINISGWEDFSKLQKLGLKLYNSKKIRDFENLMNGFKRNQISRNSYKDFYLGKLQEINKTITAEELSRKINKSKRVVSHYLLKLEIEGVIKCNKEKEPYVYFISK